MSTIFCTKTLKTFLGKSAIQGTAEPGVSFYGDWNAHLFNIKDEKNIMFVNNRSYYNVILRNIKKADVPRLSSMFIDRLSEQLIFDKVIEPDDVLIAVQRYTPVIFHGTNNDKRAIGTMNDLIYNFRFSHLYPGWVAKSLVEMNHLMNEHLVRARGGKIGDYWVPIEKMKSVFHEPVI